MKHLANEILESRGETIADYLGMCGELASLVPGADILFVDLDFHSDSPNNWKYHMVPVVDGMVHDAWCDGPPLPTKEWLTKMFGNLKVSVSVNGEDVYFGEANLYENTDLHGV